MTRNIIGGTATKSESMQMNLVTIPIYSGSNIVDSLLSSSIQLAIITQVQKIVYKKFSDRQRADRAASVSYSGKLIFSEDFHFIIDEMDKTMLQHTIFSWNKRRNINKITVDPTTIKLAREIETACIHPTGCKILTQSEIAACIITDCDRTVVDYPHLISNTSVLFDDSGRPTYLNDSQLGKQIHHQISNAIMNNQPGQIDVHIIQAPQGAGKTKFLSNLINDINCGSNRATCLSPRQQLVSSMYYGFLSEKSIKRSDVLIGASTNTTQDLVGDQPRRPSDEYNVTISTINSMENIWRFHAERLRILARLDRQLKFGEITDDQYKRSKQEMTKLSTSGNIFGLIPKQDIVVYDEFQLLRTSIMSGTHINHDQAFWIRNTMSYLEQNAKVVVALDADVDPTMIEYFAVNHPNSKIYVHRFVMSENRHVHVHTNNESLLMWTLERIQNVVAKQGNIEHPASFAIPCTSVVYGRQLVDMINHIRPDLKTIWIESKNKDESEQKAILRDPSLARQYDVIIYSPKLFTGFSFDATKINGEYVPVADTVVGLFSGTKINWMERAQSLFRIRNCTRFHFSLSNASPYESNDVDENVNAPDPSHVRREREMLFDVDGLWTPLPKFECDNSHMSLYFRSRGFDMIEESPVDNAKVKLNKIREDIRNHKKRKDADQLNEAKVIIANQLVRSIVKALGHNYNDLAHGDIIFQGKLVDGYSKLLDNVFTNDSPFEHDIQKVIHKWKRVNTRDMVDTKRIFDSSDCKYTLDVKRRHARDAVGNRCYMFDIQLVNKH